MNDKSAPKVRLDLIDRVALPGVSRDEIRETVANWKIRGKSELLTALPDADEQADDLAIAELLTESASICEVQSAFDDAGLQAGGLVDAVRLLRANYLQGNPPLALFCFGELSVRRSQTVCPVIRVLYADHFYVGYSVLRDQDDTGSVGDWSIHGLVPVRAFTQRSARSRP